jgi:hypothetical protein
MLGLFICFCPANHQAFRFQAMIHDAFFLVMLFFFFFCVKINLIQIYKLFVLILEKLILFFELFVLYDKKKLNSNSN